MSGTWRPIGIVAGWQTAASLCYYSVFAATPFIREAFGLSRALVGVLMTVLTLGYTLNLFPSGAAVDGFGEKPVMVGGLVALGAATAGVVAAPSYPVLLLAAFALGAAYAGSMPATNRAIVGAVADARRNLAMGIKQVGVTLGSAAASVVVTGIAAVAAWRAGFLLIAAVALVGTGAFALAYAGTGGTGRLERPDLGGLRANRAYLGLVSAGLFLGAALFTTVGYVVLYLTEAVGTTVGLAGIALAGAQVTGSAGRVVAGSLADRLSLPGSAARAPLAVLVGQTALAAALYAALALSTPPAPVAVALFLALGATILGLTGVYYSCLSALVDADDLGAATAGGQTALNAGALLAPPAFGWIADHLGYRASWGLLAAAALASIGLLLGVRRRV
nr:MFS transporter [Halegenticoccus soli]